MKILVLVLSLIASSSALAEDRVLQRLELDLDGDGKPDVVRVLDTGADGFYSLQISLTKDGTQLRFDRLLKKWSRQTCGEFSKDELAAGPGATLLWKEGIDTEDDMFDECRYLEKRDLAFRLEGRELRLVRADLYSQYWSMGGPAPHVTEHDDFLKGTLSLHVVEKKEFHLDRKRREKLKPGCGATLAQIEAHGYPICAALQSRYAYEELVPEDTGLPRGTPPCPSLDGAYQCTYAYGTDEDEPLPHQIVAIHRVAGQFHRYDISNDNALIADGKARLTKSDETMRILQATSCRRERLVTKEDRFLKLLPGDERKPLFDRMPWERVERTWTQLDLDGKRFSMVESINELQKSGAYQPEPTVRWACSKQE